MEEDNIKGSIAFPLVIHFMRLSIHDKELYMYILYFIATEGHCRLSPIEMKEKSRMPMTKIIAGKKVLSQKFDELGGLPFITIEAQNYHKK